MDDRQSTNNDRAYLEYIGGLEKQERLFPIEIIELYPSDQASQDLQLIGRGRDGRDYAIKTTADGNGHIPISEFFCHELSNILAIPTPAYEIVTLNDSSLAFGSVWNGSSSSLTDNNEVISLLQNQVDAPHIFEGISRIYGLDLFVNNIDRHFGNYLFVQGYNRINILAFDFGRSWHEVNFKGTEVLSYNSTTLRCKNFLVQHGKYLSDHAIDTLNKIKQIDVSSILRVFQKIPGDWFEEGFEELFLDWWGSEDFINRIDTLIEEAK